MASTTETVDRGLLWLRPAVVPGRKPAGPVATLEQTLANAATPVETVHSVYHALLHLVRDDSDTYVAAVVCVDEIEHAELEFFTILAQRDHCPPVYVYGHERSLQKLGRAIELGVTGGATPDLLRRLVTRDATSKPAGAAADEATSDTPLGHEPVAVAPTPAHCQRGQLRDDGARSLTRGRIGGRHLDRRRTAAR